MKPALVFVVLAALLLAGDFIFAHGQGTQALLLSLNHLAHKRIVE
jgi:hypothetical protein